MQKYFFIRVNGKYEKINFHEVIYIKGCRNYIKIVTDNKVCLVLCSMKRIEKFMPDYLFRRVHRSFIVSIDRIAKFDSDRVFVKDTVIPIGQQYKGDLEKAVLIVKGTICGFDLNTLIHPIPMLVNTNHRDKLFETG